MTDSIEHLTNEMKRLEIELKREEIKHLKSKHKLNWVNPAALGILLPMLAGIFLWFVSESKQYNRAYQALGQVEKLENDKTVLRSEKDSLSIEISALLDLKEHHRREAGRLDEIVQERQKIIDHAYLKGKQAAWEAKYALRHAQAGKNYNQEQTNKIMSTVRAKLPDIAKSISGVISRYHFYQDMGDTTTNILDEYMSSIDALSPSAIALKLQPHPTGIFSPGRKFMTYSNGADQMYYDLDLGRFLTKDEFNSLPSN